MEGTAVVTGGTRGLGKAISTVLHDAGFRVSGMWLTSTLATMANMSRNVIEGIPAGRLGWPSESGWLAFLASDHAGYSNRAAFDGNGGQFMG